MRYFLGVDVGGSKTHAMVADEAGHARGFGEAGMGNYQGVGYEGLREVLTKSVGQALKQAEVVPQQISGAGFGIAGFDWPSQLSENEAAVRALGLSCPIEIVNDATLGLIAGTTEGWGVAIVGGTGCNCRGRDRSGREGRVTGEGARFGEWGGAAELVARALQVVSHDWSRRGPHTELSTAFLRRTGAPDLDRFIEGVDMGRYHIDADWALLVFETAYAGDPVAQEIVRWSGRELGELACAVIRQLDLQSEPVEIVQVGGLFEGGDLYTQAVHETILGLAPRAEFVRLAVPPVVGAVLLGAHLAGLPREVLRDRLVQSTQEMFKRSA